MTLDGLEQLFAKQVWTRGQKVNLVRYADDFIITGSSKEQLENELKPLVNQILNHKED